MKQVFVKPEFRDPGEPFEIYDVIEDNGDRLMIAPESWAWQIRPVSVVASYMVQEVMK